MGFRRSFVVRKMSSACRTARNSFEKTCPHGCNKLLSTPESKTIYVLELFVEILLRMHRWLKCWPAWFPTVSSLALEQKGTKQNTGQWTEQQNCSEKYRSHQMRKRVRSISEKETVRAFGTYWDKDDLTRHAHTQTCSFSWKRNTLSKNNTRMLQ